MRNSKAILLWVLSLLLLSCGKETIPDIIPEQDVDEQKFGPEIILGEKLTNPYSLSNMQAAYESLLRTQYGEGAEIKQLEANCLYVRFLPKDSSEISVLQKLDLELFDYPLDYEIKVVGNSYHDPSIPEDQITWHYTTVKPGFAFPKITYQVLDECYIPQRADGVKAGESSDFESKLETLAILNAELPKKYQPVAVSKALDSGISPEGTIKVENDCTGVEEAIRGVKVRCQYFVNIGIGYTDKDGRYHIENSYEANPQYSIVYDNIKDFVIWGNLAFLAAANYNLGTQSNAGYSTTVKTTDDAWRWSVLNNAAYDFYEMCSTEGLKTPPADLRIWCWLKVSYSSAPMLHHLFDENMSSIVSNLIQALISESSSSEIKSIEQLIRSGVPDITIGMSTKAASPNSNYKSHYYTVWHELFHASHFSQVGASVWIPYIFYIVSNGFGYGDGTAPKTDGKNICELGESWAYANQYYSANYTWSSSIWFGQSVVSIKQLLDTEVLTRKQLYDCLTKDVRSIDDFKRKLIKEYPSKSSEIIAAFAKR